MGGRGTRRAIKKPRGGVCFRERVTNRNERRDLAFVSLPSLRILAEQSQRNGLGRTRISTTEHSVGEGKAEAAGQT